MINQKIELLGTLLINKIQITIMNIDSQPLQSQKITIDIQLLNQKQRILLNYYQLTQDQEIISLLLTWPSPISQLVQEKPILHKTNNAKYFGHSSNELFHGYGLLIYDNPEGRFYQGDFQNNCKHGTGLQYIRGDVYIGKFINNKPEDENGVFMWKNGDIFHGVFINGMKHGLGKWESGTDYYDGLWKFNKPEGQGKIHTKTSDYEGEIKNGYKHGRGVQIFTNGDKYEGLYANGKPEGDGNYHWNNGAIYKGQFKNGIRYGYGEWSYGKQKYEGEYINDKRNGQGVYKWDGGSFYKGQFLDDMRHGVGEMHWAQGAFYRGQWKEGIQNGKGQLYENGKLVSKGLFEQGKFVNQKNISNPKFIDKPSRYPKIENKSKVRSSYQSNYHQIQETPKTSEKKNPISTSFSHHTRISRKSDNTNLMGNKLQEERKQYFTKHRQSETGYRSVIKKETKSKGPTKPMIDMTETQLGPIKWKNFRHMKSPNNYGNLPQI